MFRRLKLFHRIVLHSVLMTLAVAGASVVTFHLVESPSGFQSILKRAASTLISQIEEQGDTPEAIDAKLAAFGDIVQADISLYTRDSHMVAWVGKSKLEPLDDAHVEALLKNGEPYYRRFGEVVFPVKLQSGDGYLSISWAHAEEMRRRFIIGVLVALTVIVLMSIPLARSIARPVKEITETAARIKDGDLDARAAVSSGDELAVLGSTLNDMAAGITEHIRREKELLANVSHELRTPLARIRVALEIADEAGDDRSMVKAQLSEIGEDVRELEQLVGDVLFSTKLDFSGKGPADLPLQRAETALVPFVRELAVDFERRHGVTLDLRLPDDEEKSVATIDRALLRRAVDNLLSNSLKYSRETVEISLGLDVDGGEARISVSDRGMGVSEDQLARLFEPFYRTEKSRSRNAGGMGLGLTLAKRIVDAHGGDICAECRNGGGLILSIRLAVSAV